jgi:hypothetical protein
MILMLAVAMAMVMGLATVNQSVRNSRHNRLANPMDALGPRNLRVRSSMTGQTRFMGLFAQTTRMSKTKNMNMITQQKLLWYLKTPQMAVGDGAVGEGVGAGGVVRGPGAAAAQQRWKPMDAQQDSMYGAMVTNAQVAFAARQDIRGSVINSVPQPGVNR